MKENLNLNYNPLQVGLDFDTAITHARNIATAWNRNRITQYVEAISNLHSTNNQTLIKMSMTMVRGLIHNG